jgi:hypothetical protein
MMSTFWDILEKINPPTYRPIGEMEGRVWEMNIFFIGDPIKFLYSK